LAPPVFIQRFMPFRGLSPERRFYFDFLPMEVKQIA